MSTFRFKRFCVRNELSAMKVNTDGVLLGAAVRLDGKCRRILDVGTGTGTIALMAAQRMYDLLGDEGQQWHITGIDIDAPSAHEAAGNFEASPWKGHLSCRNCSLQDFASEGNEYDLIVSNPPYFDNSLTNPDERECAARHSVSLSGQDLARFAADALSAEGRLAVILPSDRKRNFLREAASFGLFPCRIMDIRTTPRKEPCRFIAELGRQKCVCLEEGLTINEGSTFSKEYLSLTEDFYLSVK